MELSKREEVIKLSAKVYGLREEIASRQKELQLVEEQLDSLLEAALPAVPLQPTLGERLMAGIQGEDKSLNQSIVDLLLLSSPADMDADELVAQLSEGTNITSVRSALARLADQGRVRRTTRGRYAATEQADAPHRIAS